MLNVLGIWSLVAVPNELILVEDRYPIFISILLFLSFLILALAKYSHATIYRSLAIALTKNMGVLSYVRESMPLKNRSSLLLVLNYIISSSLVMFLALEKLNLDDVERVFASLSLPLLLFFKPIFLLLLTGWVTGEQNILKESIVNKIVGIQFTGIIYFICGLLWVLNSGYANIILDVFLWIFIVENILYLIKSIIVVYSKGVGLFYIIVYLCTFEILPLLVIFYVIMRDFGLYI